MNPILLLHGALGSSSQLEPLKALLEKKGRQVFMLNFSGHSGKSFSDRGFGIEVFAQDVANFLHTNFLNQTDVFGYSMGGYVALWAAHQNPAAFGKIITLGTKFDWSPESAAREVQKLDSEKIIEKVPAFARILEHRHSPNDWRELIRKTSVMMRELGENPLITPKVLQQIQHEITVLLGDQDDMADRAHSIGVAHWLPNGRFELLPSTPHLIEKVQLTQLLDFI